VLDADNFIQAVQGESVKERMDSAARVQRQTNRKKLMSIIEVILFCGRQGIALRGHRDVGPLTLEDPLENDGNFRALVRLKIFAAGTTFSEITWRQHQATRRTQAHKYKTKSWWRAALWFSRPSSVESTLRSASPCLR
ncbi:unnamed protein product, partial [Ixodes hexagonus]